MSKPLPYEVYCTEQQARALRALGIRINFANPCPPVYDLHIKVLMEIDRLLNQNRKIAAIKAYRDEVVCDLLSAKKAIDEHVEFLAQAFPDPSP